MTHDILHFVSAVARSVERPRLAGEDDVLIERIRQLEELLAPSVDLPAVWSLTPSERTVFRVLLARDVATYDAMMAALYGDRPSDPPEVKIIQIFIHRLRRKLTAFGPKIEVVRSQGYRLADRQKWKAALQPETNTEGAPQCF